MTVRLGTLRLERGLIERGLNDEYDALAHDLTAAGWTVIEPRRGYEQRDAGAVSGALTALIVYVVAKISDAALDEIAAAIVKNLRLPRRPKHPPRYGYILDVSGRVLRKIELDDPPPADE